ncbi:MAG: SUMF1/EgtB/PvdO family nonheme iron enzyme [Planctomycetaceae bacterium]|nr:SUMF1/EgtB/PvdO family nonheme iron enzyme [Planctomycetaceae bacterium]
MNGKNLSLRLRGISSSSVVHWVLCMVAAGIAGCGGGSESKTPSTPPPLPPPPVTRAVPRGPSRPAIGVTKPAVETPKPRKTITSRDFQVGGDEPNFVSYAPNEVVRGSHYLIPPVEGKGFADVLVVPPPNDSEIHFETRLKLPEGFVPIEEQGVHPNGLPHRIQSVKDQMEMALVPGGLYQMGTNTGPQNARPEHLVYVSPFYVDVHEVTLTQYLKFNDDVRASEKPFAYPGQPGNKDDGPNHPALGIQFSDAMNYAKFYGKSLPTEAEWEKAARGSSSGIYPWGNGRPLWSPARTFGQITSVGQFLADTSPFGAVDMSGNAREWVSDWYAEDAYTQSLPSDGSPLRDPTGPIRQRATNNHVVKGGGEQGWELYHRGPGSPRDRIPDVGFRCVLRVTPEMLGE